MSQLGGGLVRPAPGTVTSLGPWALARSRGHSESSPLENRQLASPNSLSPSLAHRLPGAVTSGQFESASTTLHYYYKLRANQIYSIRFRQGSIRRSHPDPAMMTYALVVGSRSMRHDHDVPHYTHAAAASTVYIIKRTRSIDRCSLYMKLIRRACQ